MTHRVSTKDISHVDENCRERRLFKVNISPSITTNKLTFLCANNVCVCVQSHTNGRHIQEYKSEVIQKVLKALPTQIQIGDLKKSVLAWGEGAELHELPAMEQEIMERLEQYFKALLSQTGMKWNDHMPHRDEKDEMDRRTEEQSGEWGQRKQSVSYWEEYFRGGKWSRTPFQLLS